MSHDVKPNEKEILNDDNLENSDDVNETEELSDEEKEKLRIEEIKSHHLNYQTKKHFGVNYKKERARKNRVAKKSRKINRRK